MASPSSRTFDSVKRSWASSGRRSPTESSMQHVERAASPQRSTSPRLRSSSPAIQRSPSPTSPRRSRSFGADSYSVDYLKRQSLSVNAEARDPGTQMISEIPECDARCTLVIKDLVWVGERDGSITIRRVLDGEVVHIIERRKATYVWCMISVNGTVWAGCSDGFIRVLSVASYKMDRQFARHAGGGGGVHTLAYHAPSGTVFSGSNDFEILAWRADTCDFLKQLPAHAAVRALLVDQHTLYSACDDGSVMVWDVLTGQRTAQWQGHKKSVHSLCMTENHVWSGSEDGTICIWNPQNGECVAVAEVRTGTVSVLTSMGDRVWSAAGDTVCVWDANDLKLLGTYVCHEGYIECITVMAKLTQFKVWTLANDRVAKVWTAECTPDESAALRRKLERLQDVDYKNRQLQEKLALQDREMAELKNQLGAANEELEGLRPLVPENQRLRDTLQQKEGQIRDLQDQLRDAERRNADLTSQVENLNRMNAELRATNQNLTDDLAAARRDYAALQDEMREQRQRFEAELEDCRNTIRDLTSQNHQLNDQLAQCRVENGDLRAEVEQALLEMERMKAKLREMDIIFKSRLSLITEVFKLYKRFEANDKKLKGVVAQHPDAKDCRDEIVGTLIQFKGTIAHHFTDDELNHLGSSRHFFPTEAASPSRGPASPTGAGISPRPARHN